MADAEREFLKGWNVIPEPKARWDRAPSPQRPGSAWVAEAPLLLELVAEVWQPNWAGIMSKKAVCERQMNASRPFVDWMVYVPRSITTVPSPARVEIVEGLGSIIVMQPDPPTGAESNEQSRIQRVEEILAA